MGGEQSGHLLLPSLTPTGDGLVTASGVVRLAAPQRGVLRILEVSGLVEVLHTYPTVDEAVTAEEPALD